MRKFISFLLVILSIIIGCIFLYSAYTKLFPIQRFEYTMVETVHFPWFIAAFAARFLIGFEALLGALILLHLYGRNKWVLKVAIGLLLVFSVYLIWLWAIEGNKVNCGCFGDTIWMSPSSSLIKNIILIIGLILLNRFHNRLRFRFSAIAMTILLVAGFIVPFILYPIPQQQPGWLQKNHFKLDLSALYEPGKKDIPTENLYKGKYIIAYLSATCPHCQMAAYKMHLMKENNPALPFFMIIGGKRDLGDFWKITKAQNIPYCRLDRDRFLNATGGTFPVIDWVNNDWVEAQTDYITLNQAQIEKWLKK